MTETTFKEKLYRSNINLSSYPDYVPILAGRQFTRKMIHPTSFSKLVEQSHIEEVLNGVPAIEPVSTKPGSLTVGLRNETPDAAMHPPVDKSTLGLLNALNPINDISSTHQKVVAAEGNPDAAIVPVASVTPAIPLEGSNSTQFNERATAVSAWNIDPATLKGLPLIQLLEIYTRMCSNLEISPVQFKDRDKLIAQLSSEFKSK